MHEVEPVYICPIIAEAILLSAEDEVPEECIHYETAGDMISHLKDNNWTDAQIERWQALLPRPNLKIESVQ